MINIRVESKEEYLAFFDRIEGRSFATDEKKLSEVKERFRQAHLKHGRAETVASNFTKEKGD